MASRHWYPHPGPLLTPEFPAIARLILAAFSGAVLSLSFYGAHSSFYSWFCVAILLFSALGSRARVAFFCGFLHGLIFVLTCVSWVAEVLSVHGGMSAAAGWAGLFLIGTVSGCANGRCSCGSARVSQKGI